MKRALHKSAFREIRSTMNRFLSIFGIVAIGVGFFSGVRAAAPNMRKTSDSYYTENHLMDLRLVSTYGFDENDIRALKDIPGSAVYPSYFADLIVNSEGRSPIAARVYSLSDALINDVNVIQLTKGRMPENENECIINVTKFGSVLPIGEKVRFSDSDGKDPDNMLNVYEYEIVGECTSPMYIDKSDYGNTQIGNGSIEESYYIPESNFSVKYNTEVYLRFPALDRYNCYEDDYKERIDEITKALEPIADTRSEERFTDIKKEADEEIEKAENKLSDAQKEADEKIADGERELNDARQQLSDAKKEIDDGEREINENEQKLEDGKAELEKAKTDIADGEKQIAENEKKLIDGRAELDKAKQELADGESEIAKNDEKLADAEKQLNDAKKEIDDGERQIAENEKKLNDGKAELDKAKNELEANEKLISENEKKIEDGRKELEKGKKELESGEKEIAVNERKLRDGKAELDSAKRQIDDGERQLKAAEAKLKEGKQQLDDAKAQIAYGERQIAANEKKIADGKIQLEKAKKEIEDGERQIAENEKLLADSKVQLEEARKQIETGEALISYFNGLISRTQERLEKLEEELAKGKDLLPETISYLLEKIDEAKAEISWYGERLAEAKDDLADGRAEYEAGLEQYNEGLRLLEAAKTELANGKAEYEKGLKDITEGEKQLADAKRQLADGKAEYEAGLLEYIVGENEYNSAKTQLSTAKIQYEAGLKEYNSGVSQIEAAKKKIEEGWDEYYDGLGEIEDGEKQLADGKKQLSDGWDKYNDGVKELEDGEKQLDEAKEKLADGKAEYDKGMAEYLDGKKQLDEAKAQLNDGRAEYEKGLDEYLDGERKLTDAKISLADGKADYAGGLLDVMDGEKQLNDAKEQLADGKAEYEEGLQKLADGEKELEEGKAEAREKIDDAKKKLADAKEEVENLSKPKWYVFSRTDNPGYSEYGENSERISNISTVFPVFFILVAVLVCLTTMSRMIEEQRVQIGTLKALGYPDSDIIFKYMFYAVSATVAGSVIGSIIGMYLFPFVIITAYSMLYDLPKPVIEIDFMTGMLSTAVFSAATAATVWLTARSSLKEEAAQLMRPKTPKIGKRILLERITPIWRMFNFSAKVTARNLFRYKRKMLMTVIGISGCTALLVTGFALHDSINDIVVKHFGELLHYDGSAIYNTDANPRAADEAEEILSAHGDHMRIFQKIVTASANGKNVSVCIVVPSRPEKITEFVTLRDRISGKGYTLSDGDIYLDEKSTLLLKGIQAGDEIGIAVSDTDTRYVTITAGFENYPGHYIYMTENTYREIFGETPEYNTVYFRSDLGEENNDTLSRRLLSIDGVVNVSFNSSSANSFKNLLVPLDYVVFVIIAAAGLLAFVVLYNLTNINITERIREIATLKVLGFYDGEVDSYIFRENILLSLLGTGAGLILGKFLATFVIVTAEVDIVMFGRSIYPMSYILAAAVTMLFSFAVTLAMHRRLKKINMIEALKSVE